ncbi:hypothetical protein J4468_01900 [Candidatus Woesearchaeota archaeon]|nr:hypothetical protein [Candidatus Woesearchaeota archaeon]
MKHIITTFPLGTRKIVPPLGILMSPVLADAFNKLIPDSQSYILLNTLDSYQDRIDLAPNFVQALSTVSIDNPEQIWIDGENMSQLFTTIKKLEKIGIMKEESTLVKRCECGKVEMLNEVEPNPKARFYSTYGDNMVCKLCETPVIPLREDCLTITYPKTIVPPKVIPDFMQKEVETHIKHIQKNRFLVSRHNRDCPTYTAISGKKYGLDVDFWWQNCLDGLAYGSESMAIHIIGSNHVAWQISLTYALYYSLNPEKNNNVELILPSYIINPRNIENITKGEYQDISPEFNRALLLSSLSWKHKNSDWNQSLSNKIAIKKTHEDQDLIQKINEYNSFNLLKLITNRKNISLYLKGKLNDPLSEQVYNKII